MNSDTGHIYIGQDAIDAARRRGEPIEDIGPRVAEIDKILGQMPVVTHEQMAEQFGITSTDESRRAALRDARNGVRK